MEQTPDFPGVCVELNATSLACDGTAGRIVPSEYTLRKDLKLKLARAFRSERDWNRVYKHRANFSAYLNNVVQFPGGATPPSAGRRRTYDFRDYQPVDVAVTLFAIQSHVSIDGHEPSLDEAKQLYSRWFCVDPNCDRGIRTQSLSSTRPGQ